MRIEAASNSYVNVIIQYGYKYDKEYFIGFDCIVTLSNNDELYLMTQKNSELAAKYDSIKFFSPRLVHDLRNDLNIITCHLIMMEPNNTIDVISATVTHMVHYLNVLLDTEYLLHNGEFIVCNHTESIVDLCEHLLNDVIPLASSHNILAIFS